MAAQSTLPDDPRGQEPRTEHAPYLIRLLQCERPLVSSSRHALTATDVVTIGRGDQRSIVRSADKAARRLALQVADPFMSTAHCQLVRVLGRWVVQDAGSRNGTLHNGVACKQADLEDGDLIEAGHTLFLFRELTAVDGAPDLDAAQLDAPAPGLATLDPELGQLFASLPDVARAKVPVAVRGASGTGKELVARAVHALSGRRGAYLAVNCGALPDTLVESELFGHKKGAFSGAVEDRPGLVRAADHGTLFLDEVGDLPLPSQAALLRVLQEEEVLPVGATRAMPVDLRVVVATHRDLPQLVKDGRFRADLYARLAGWELELPALADRKEDLGIIIAALLARLAPDRPEIGFSQSAARALVQHEWPLNVRELEQALAAGLALAREHLIDLPQLPEALRSPSPRRNSTAPLSDEDARRRDQLAALLTEHQGNISAVARAMGKARMQIQRWMKRYGLPK
jgi:transcriptional regulator with PAS, ATPase and Fis domain